MGRHAFTEEERRAAFWSKVAKRESGCWEWTAAHMGAGYGLFSVGTKMVVAHRVAYEFSVGPIADGLELDHLCRNPPCVNPAHLEPVSHRVNALRGEGVGAKNARRESCHKGHAFDEANTLVSSGRRRCRRCAHERYLRERMPQ